MTQEPNSDRSNRGVTDELRATQTADPATELRKAIQKGDLRFLGVAGFSLMVPGVPGEGYVNPVVAIRGVHRITGTSDVIESREQERLQPIAYQYAERYNRLLMEHLLRVNDPAVSQTRRKIDQELTRLERLHNPIEDAKKALQERPPLLLMKLPSSPAPIPGVDTQAWRAAEQTNEVSGVFCYPIGPFVFVTAVMTPLQRRRLVRQVTRYIVPYNRYVFRHHRSAMDKENERRQKLLRKYSHFCKYCISIIL